MRDAAGAGIDAILEFPDGRWLAAEAKLGGPAAVESAAESLLRLASKVNDRRLRENPCLVAITAVGYGYSRPDGVHVVPITALGP